ncbi:MAG: sensor histidine kinase, partial [Actinomycetota bacterium]|nr:sensor histidine kinase [Actinomycetota bacterium]
SESLVELSVADDGPGIEKEDLPHVFERLYVSRHQPEERESGSGLGLAIVKELVTAMEGGVEIISTPGSGTTIKVTFPKK